MTLDVLSLLPTAGARVSLVAAQVAVSRFSGAAGSLRDLAVAVPAPLIDVPAQGVSFPFDWGPPLEGTDRVDLAPIGLEVAADPAGDFAGYPLGELATQVTGDGELVVTVPTGRRIRSLHLADLRSEDVTFTSEQSLKTAGRKLTVSQPDPRGGWAAPVVSVPAVGRQGQVPATLTGADFGNGVLRMPDLTGPLKISVVEGATPDEFSVHRAGVGTVVGWAAPTPVDLTLTGPDGAVLWTFAGALPAGTRQSTDVTVPVAAAVEALRNQGAPIAGALTLSAAFPCRVRLRIGTVHGDLVRALAGTSTIDLAGEPARLPVTPPLPPAAPATVVADVAVSYAGRRLADISDPLPAAGSHRGVVVRQQPVLRTLAPQALRGERVSRIGLVGYCPQPAALLVRLVPAIGGGPAGVVPAGPGAVGPVPGAVGPVTPGLGSPATVKVERSTAAGVIWVDLPEPVTIDRPVAIEVSAGTGTLNWIAAPEPLVRIVVLDPDPGGRPVVLDAATLLTVDRPELGSVRAALPAAAFAGGPPTLASALFCRVEITDAELRFPRGT